MTEKEMRELDAWIGENVMGMKGISMNDPRPTQGTEDDYFVREWIDISHSLPHYTTDRAAAMMVRRAILERGVILISSKSSIGFKIIAKLSSNVFLGEVVSDTDELSICEIAKKIWLGRILNEGASIKDGRA